VIASYPDKVYLQLFVSMSCISPYFAQHKGEWLPHPCGRCPPCKRRRIDGWVFRMLQEEKNYSSPGRFITLTYDTDHVPISPHGFMTLDKSAFPNFMKRLRKLAPGVKMRYYASGEYGDERRRPHYHAIVFGCPDDNLFHTAWALGGVSFGRVDVDQVTGRSIAYTVGYINKSDWQKIHSRDDRVPEFSLMSKGLGANYVTPAIVAYHKADLSRNYLSKPGGDRIAMPRYYRERIFDDDERSMQQGLAEVASGIANSEKYERFLRLYGDSDGFDYQRYLDDERERITHRFYNNQKPRL